jgi:hypothetical protein
MKVSPRVFRSCFLVVVSIALVPGCEANPPAKAPTGDGTSNTAPPEGTTTTPVPAAPTAPAVVVSAEPQTICDLVCEQARVVAPQADTPGSLTQATENANKVIEAMQGDLLACYKKRVAVNPKAHGFILVDILVGPDGHVRTVDTTGGAILGEGTMKCIVDRVRTAVFAPPHAGGTLRIQVPFSLRSAAPGEEA